MEDQVSLGNFTGICGILANSVCNHAIMLALVYRFPQSMDTVGWVHRHLLCGGVECSLKVCSSVAVV